MNEQTVMQVTSLEEFFRDELHGAARKQHLTLEDQTEHYVVNMLASFSRSDVLFEPGTQGARLRPLALMLAEALGAPTLAERQHALQRLGDVSLFVAGFLPRSFARRLVDVDYHIAMGGRAYGSLADTARGGTRGGVIARVFEELAAKFGDLVDALNEIAEAARPPRHEDLLRLYEIWMKTGSARAAGRLRALGVEPAAASRVAWSH
jgi:hypothetical protein